jgi:hypothetical protein
MKGKFGVAALMLSSVALASPVSTPNDLSDTPIISGGGSGEKLSMNNCRAYQTNGAAIDLSGGETLVFYGSGGDDNWGSEAEPASFGGYLATKTTYSGTAYVKVKGGREVYIRNWGIVKYYGKAGYAIGLFARNSEQKTDFIAGAGAGGISVYAAAPDLYNSQIFLSDKNLVSGGGWAMSGQICMLSHYPPVCYSRTGGDISRGWWFSDRTSGCDFNPNLCNLDYYPTPGFHSGYIGTGGASSISAFYDSYTRDYTSPVNSLTISKGGFWGLRPPALYVCQ